MPLTKITTGVIADNTITTADIATGTIVSGDILDGTITSTDMALDPRNASNLSSGSVPSAQLGNVDTGGLQADIALLAFKTQANGNLSRYNLVDQSVDAFEDATGISAGDSTNEIRNSSGKYYSGVSSASGGTFSNVTISDVVYDLFTFTVSGTLTAGAAANVDILVVGGGGTGGKNIGGGGGAGGLVYKPAQAITASAYAITIGGGGVGASPWAGANGGDTIFDTGGVTNTLTGKGGGYAGGHATAGSGAIGGSGGADGGGSGDAGAGNQTSQPGDSGTYGFGTGGSEGAGASNYAGGGGGGAGNGFGTPGTTGTGSPHKGGNGGAGKDYSGTFGTGVGSSGWFGGGGGGSIEPGSGEIGYGNGGDGNPGGGGDGSTYPGTGVSGTANTGGGGGGGTTGVGGNGGSGIVIIRSAENALSTYSNMTLESITTTTATAPTKGDLVFTYTNGVGTAVVGTNITAEYSADAGSTWTDFGIAAADTQGTTGGHTIVTKNNVSLTSTSGTNMRYRIKTLVQSDALATRIHAVSLGWS